MSQKRHSKAAGNVGIMSRSMSHQGARRPSNVRKIVVATCTTMLLLTGTGTMPSNLYVNALLVPDPLSRYYVPLPPSLPSSRPILRPILQPILQPILRPSPTRLFMDPNIPKEAPPCVTEVDVLYGYKTPLIYDKTLERYVPSSHDDQLRRIKTRFLPIVRNAFLPEGVSPSYYKFVRYRILQRFLSSNVHVLGTQSLLLGLGLKNKSLGLSAAMNWVLKDALGKITRMLWASKMGRRFDSDAKRWRYRASFLFALGNFLEIVTFMCPQLFLLFATVSNCCKQVSMLTSSSTRTTIYNSFRDGTRENIGDIFAKGEAQIAVVDLLGIASGVALSRIVGLSIPRVLAVYFTLQIAEIWSMYHTIIAVQFRVLNFERMMQVVAQFVVLAFGQEQKSSSTIVLSSPPEISAKERVFLPPHHLARRAIAFGSLGRAKLAPNELSDLIHIFRHEKFLLIVGADKKNRRHEDDPAANCHVVLHVDADNEDIVKGTLALSILRRKLSNMDHPPPLRSRDCLDTITQAKEEADAHFPSLLASIETAGWAAPARSILGRVTMRADWPLLQNPGN